MHIEKDAVWALVGIGWALWTIGGAGPKWVRRFLWPAVLAGATIWLGGVTHWALVGATLMSALLTFGYGENDPWPKKLLLFELYGLVLVCFGVPWWWGLVTLGVLAPMKLLSERANWFAWKWWEGTAGALQGFAVARALLHGG